MQISKEGKTTNTPTQLHRIRTSRATGIINSNKDIATRVQEWHTNLSGNKQLSDGTLEGNNA